MRYADEIVATYKYTGKSAWLRPEFQMRFLDNFVAIESLPAQALSFFLNCYVCADAVSKRLNLKQATCILRQQSLSKIIMPLLSPLM